MASPCRVSNCPIVCVFKTVVVALVAVFVLFFPLGDPVEVCNRSKSHKQSMPVLCLCDVYIKSMKLFNKTKEVVGVIVCRVLELLYDAKLKFYTILNKVDGGDLYESVCCSDSENIPEDSGEKTPPCKCIRKCCRKNTALN